MVPHTGPYPSSQYLQTLEKSLPPYTTANIPNTPTQYRYKTQHSTVTALHTVNNTVAKGYNQMVCLARTPSHLHHHHIYTHKHECSQEIHITIPASSFCLDKTKQYHTKSRQNNLHSVYSRSCRIYE